MKNRLEDLTNHLFAQIERLGVEDLDAEQIRAEIQRAGAMTGVAREIIAAGHLALSATRISHDLGPGSPPLKLLGLDR
jgi:hypothetical protein